MATKVYIIYYSMYGHVDKLAQEIQKGASSVEGVEAELWQVPETLPAEVLEKMHAPPKSNMLIISPNQLPEAYGLIFGFRTHFGMMCAQFKVFLDASGGLWQQQKLVGKPAGLFTSTASQGGGQETTLLTAVTQLAHHGMLFVPTCYGSGRGMYEMEKVKGGSLMARIILVTTQLVHYLRSKSTLAGQGTRMPSELELEQAFFQGKHIATIAKKLKASD